MYYFNSNDNTTHSSEQSNDNQNQNNHRNGPLFSQPFNPSSMNGAPTDFSQEIDFSNYDASNTLFNESLFDTSQMYNWDLYNAQVPTSMDPQEAILLSDPNFLRQHQLLQDQQREMHNRSLHDNEDEQKQQVSNLTAMFDHSQKQRDREEAPVELEPQDAAVEAAAEEEEEDRKQKKSNNRKQHVLVKEDANKIDHQRRFNELQARFRVNYARKPTQQQTVKSSSSNINTSSSNITTTTNTNNTITNTNTTTNTALNVKSKSVSPPPPQPASFEERVSIPPPPVKATPVAIGGLVMNNSSHHPEENEFSTSLPSRTMPIQIQRVPRNSGSQPFDADSHQKQLDMQLDKVDFDDITVSELKEMLRQRGKPATGKKAVLLQRLQEERDLARGGRSVGSYGKLASHRHSQPLPFSRSVNDAPQRPRSFQGTSPVMIQQNAAVAGSYGASPSSPGGYLPGSPSASLHRSIANMHIGSPPAVSRRYSPYSPRLSSSPKPTHQDYYSSSVPINNAGSLSSSPVNNSMANNMNNTSNMGNSNNMMLSLSYSTARPGRYYNNPKTYKPFTSSALATPDREEDVNPFDTYYGGGGDPSIKEEDNPAEQHSDCMINNSNNNNNPNNMDWLDINAFDTLLQQHQASQQQQQQQQQQDMNYDMGNNNQLPQLTNDQLIALLNSQQQQNNAFDFKLEESSYHSQPYYHHQ